MAVKRVSAVKVDIGHHGYPGGSQSEITCELVARSDGKWEAVGEYRRGSNQGVGHFQIHIDKGPWKAIGDTAGEAVMDMVHRAEDEYQDHMRRAGHDAVIELDGRKAESFFGKENPLEEFSDKQILAEVKRRGLIEKATQ